MYTQADLHQAFLEMHYAKRGNVREFLASLCCKQEKLAAIGVSVTKKEYEQTILQGIPSKLVTFASYLLSLALIVHGTASIDLDTLINQICEKANQLKSRHGKEQSSKKDPTIDEALATTASNNRKQ